MFSIETVKGRYSIKKHVINKKYSRTLSLLEFPPLTAFVVAFESAPDVDPWAEDAEAFRDVGAVAADADPGTAADDEDEFFFDLDEDEDWDDDESDDLLGCFFA